MANICPCTFGNSVSQALNNLRKAKKLNEKGCIAPYFDTTILKDKDRYYRISKDETEKKLILEMSDSLTGNFTRIHSPLLDSLEGLEGPEGYLLPDQKTWCIIADQFQTGKGYLPMITENLESGVLTVLPEEEYDMGATRKRHGGVLPVTDEEYERLEKLVG